MQPSERYAVILRSILLLAFGVAVAPWLAGRTELYFAVMHALGVDAFSRPFLDLSGVLSMGECHRLGVDATAPNPCDLLHRRLPYGPPLLQEPFATADTNVLGVLQSLLFLAAIPLVLRPRTRIELLTALAATLSCGVLYALERGNFDIVEFLLIALGVFAGTRGNAGRLASYLLFFVGGMLKFYPFALLVTIVRERLGMAIGLAMLGFAGIVAYAIAYREMLAGLAKGLPSFEYNTDVFGAACLPFGLADWLTLPALAGNALMALLVAGFGFLAWRIGRRLHVTLERSDFETVNVHLLVAGAVVLVSCFFMGPNITYRSIFLLLILPGLFDFARRAGLRGLANAAIGIALFCLWSEFFRQWGEAAIDALLDMTVPDRGDSLLGEVPSMMFFVIRELMWWWLIALLAAIALAFFIDAPAIRGLRNSAKL